MSSSILIVEDDAIFAKNISRYLSHHGYDVCAVQSGEEALANLGAFKPDLVLLDFYLPGMDGLKVLERIRTIDAEAKVIIMTGYGGAELGVAAIEAGAYAYLFKPLALVELKLLLEKAVGHDRLEAALAYYQDEQAQASGLLKLLGESPSIVSVKNRIRACIDAERDVIGSNVSTVLVSGECGTGKELVARAIHFDGRRREKPFVTFNCLSTPAHLMEATLFGFGRGASSSTRHGKTGLMESADGGTLFVDEIGNMDLDLQAKLLMLLETQRMRRVGGQRERNVDLRIIASAKQNLADRVQRGDFRSDLFHRLSGTHVALPPLRERGADVILLANEFLRSYGRRYGKGELHFAPKTELGLQRYHWPGNVRELRNVVERTVLLTDTARIEPRHLGLHAPLGQKPVTGGDGSAATGNLPEEGVKLAEVESSLLARALERTNWNVTRAAKLVGLSRDTLRYRMEKYKLRSN